MTTIIKRCIGEKKIGVMQQIDLEKKSMIPDFEIPECPEFEGKSKIGIIFVNEEILEE